MISVQTLPPEEAAMLKWVQCVRRRPEVTVVEFRRKWQEYGEAIVSLGAELGAVRVEVSAALVVDANAEWQLRRGSAAPFDGLAEIHFSGSAPEFFAAIVQPGPKELAARLLTAAGGFRRRLPFLLLPRLAGRGSLVLARRGLTIPYSAASIGTKLPSCVPFPPGTGPSLTTAYARKRSLPEMRKTLT